MTEHRYLSLRQVQVDLGLSADELDQVIRSGRLPAFRIAGRWRVDRLMLERLVDDLITECEPMLRHSSVLELPMTRATTPPEAGRDRPAVAVPPQRAAPQARGLGLTEQQQRIVRLIADGMSNAEIAGRLSVEVSTVKSHVSRVLQRLNLRDREQLIAHAWRSGVMDSEV